MVAAAWLLLAAALLLLAACVAIVGPCTLTRERFACEAAGTAVVIPPSTLRTIVAAPATPTSAPASGVKP